MVAFRSPCRRRWCARSCGAGAGGSSARTPAALADQLANVRRFGGERFTSTDLDLIGNAVWRLLREAERAESAPAGPAAGTHPGPAPDDEDDGDAGGPGTSVTFRI